jgi:hypothetical protein
MEREDVFIKVARYLCDRFSARLGIRILSRDFCVIPAERDTHLTVDT